jgi:hypothetical protein
LKFKCPLRYLQTHHVNFTHDDLLHLLIYAFQVQPQTSERGRTPVHLDPEPALKDLKLINAMSYCYRSRPEHPGPNSLPQGGWTFQSLSDG